MILIVEHLPILYKVKQALLSKKILDFVQNNSNLLLVLSY